MRVITFTWMSVLAIALLATSCAKQPATTETWSYNQFTQAVEQGQIAAITINSDRAFAVATTQDGEQILVDIPPNDPALIESLARNNIRIRVKPQNTQLSYPLNLIWLLLPGLLSLVGLVFWMWILIDCATKEANDGNTKIVWILIILFASGIGALIYFFFRRPQRLRELGR